MLRVLIRRGYLLFITSNHIPQRLKKKKDQECDFTGKVTNLNRWTTSSTLLNWCISSMVTYIYQNIFFFSFSIWILFLFKNQTNLFISYLYHSLRKFSRSPTNWYLFFHPVPRKQTLAFQEDCLLNRQFAWNVKAYSLENVKLFQKVIC